MALRLMLAAAALTLSAQTVDVRTDAALRALIPADTIFLAGFQIDALRQTPVFQRLLDRQPMAELDELAARAGFDPRKDVRYLLAASNGSSAVLIARGAFSVKPQAALRRVSHRGVALYVSRDAGADGYAIIDPTTAIVSSEARMRQAIDHKLNRAPGVPLTARTAGLPARAQMWSVASAFSKLTPESGSGGMNALAALLRNVDDVTMWADLRSGVVAQIKGECRSEEDARKLRDTLRGFVGLARLGVPEKQPEMLRFYDGFKAESTGRVTTMDIQVPPALLDAFVRFAAESNNGARKR